MIHVKQKEGLGTCGAVAYAAILHLSELQGIRECKTKMRGKGSGTPDCNLRAAFKARGIATHVASTDYVERLGEIFWLPLLSTHFPLYVAFKDKKNSSSSHAIAIADGVVYDGHNDGPVPLELYLDKWVDHIIVVDLELETYQ